MLKTLPAFIAGFVVAFALLASLTVLGQADLIGRIRPAVIDIQQSVPVLAEIDGATVPITVDVALQVSLSGPITASVQPAAPPEIRIGELKAAADNDGPMIDTNGLPYTLENSAGMEEIHLSSKVWLDSFSLIGEFTNPVGARPFESFDVQITATLYDEGDNVVGIAHGWPDLATTEPGQRTSITAISSTNMADVTRYAVQIYRD